MAFFEANKIINKKRNDQHSAIANYKYAFLQIRCRGDKAILVLGSARTFPPMVRDWISSPSLSTMTSGGVGCSGGCPDWTRLDGM